MKLFMLGLSTLCVLTACTKADIETSSKVSNVEAVVEAVKPKTRTDELQTDETKAFHYMIMDDFSQEMGAFVGLKAGDSFAVAEGKINTVFKSYDGHSEPHDIAMDKSIVEANWKQVLVTQDGLMDGTVTGQQLLAIFDDEEKLVSYGMRIKCHTENGSANWQNTVCE